MSEHLLGTVDRARGRWREILPQLGIETRFLSNKRGPCPLCGGKDRFRFDDKNGTGSYFCQQCGPGIGVMLVRKLNKWDFKTACDAIDRIIGDAKPVSLRAPRPKSDVDTSRRIERLLASANDQSVVTAYLGKRGLRDSSAVLRGHQRCPCFDEGGKFLGRYPAVVAPVIAPDGTLESAMRIYDADVEPRKKVMTPRHTLNGAAVRLFEPSDVLGVGEGIETCLAAHELWGIPVWSALNANGLKTFVPPTGIKSLVVFGDNDSNFVGQTAAYSLAERIKKTGIAVKVHIMEEPDTDWLDYLNRWNHWASATCPGDYDDMDW